jgi:hypothetical protein
MQSNLTSLTHTFFNKHKQKESNELQNYKKELITMSLSIKNDVSYSQVFDIRVQMIARNLGITPN